MRPRQYAEIEAPYAEGTAAGICADVTRLKDSGVSVIVSLHWGEEFVPVPSQAETKLARSIIDAGASVILGHHPHVTRPVERYKAGLIAYSLGNFVGDMVWYAPFRRGAILRCTVGVSGVTNPKIVATHLDDDYRPRLNPSFGAGLPEVDVVGLSEADYETQIARTMREQRIASYRFALINLPKTPLPILIQMVTQTIRNKLAALAPRLWSGTGVGRN